MGSPPWKCVPDGTFSSLDKFKCLMKKISSFLLLTISCFCSAPLQAAVTLPALFSNHMVLQKSDKVPIWGHADPGERVTVVLNGHEQSDKADPNGKWKVQLDLSKSGAGPFEMSVNGGNQVVVSDVLVGEVWVGSGQSNMEFELKNCANAVEEILNSANPMLRQFKVAKQSSPEPQEDVKGEWVLASPETSGSFSAVAYYFAKKLQAELKVPVGILNTSWGGTPSEAWTSPEAIASDPGLTALKAKTEAQLKAMPQLMKDYQEALGSWFKKNGMEDRPTADSAMFAAPEASTEGWSEIMLPGEIKGAGVPLAGAVWLRKEFLVSAPAEKAALRLYVAGALESVYWDGKRVAQTDLNRIVNFSASHKTVFDLPPGLIHEGRNVLAVRLYHPLGSARLADLSIELVDGPALRTDGKWLAKAEFELPKMSAETLAQVPKGVPAIKGPQPISRLFNGMVQPLIPYAMRGVIWYQGESNADRAFQYRTAFPLMITDWRSHWGRGDFPFYFCQLANHTPKQAEPGESPWAELREAQQMTLKLPNTGEAVLIDLGEANDIHPRNKKDVGERLARIALARDYGQAVEFSGPAFDHMTLENAQAVLHFKPTAGGLMASPLPATYPLSLFRHTSAPLVRNSPASQIEGFALCGQDQKWFWADAKIVENSVVVSSSNVLSPVAVRYGWANNPTCNLYNGAGLPAAPFRTDDFPGITHKKER